MSPRATGTPAGPLHADRIGLIVTTIRRALGGVGDTTVDDAVDMIDALEADLHNSAPHVRDMDHAARCLRAARWFVRSAIGVVPDRAAAAAHEIGAAVAIVSGAT